MIFVPIATPCSIQVSALNSAGFGDESPPFRLTFGKYYYSNKAIIYSRFFYIL